MSGEVVLIVHDHRDYIEFLMTRVLAPQGLTILIAQDGEQAKRKALDVGPDLIILNGDMAGGGLPLLKLLREQGCDSIVVFITRHGSLEGAVEAMRLGAQDYIIRPDDDETMRRAVNRALSRRRTEVQAASGPALPDRQAERQVHDMRILSAVGRRILSVLEWEKLLPRIVDAAVYLVASGEGRLALVNEATGELRTLAAKMANEEQACFLTAKPEKDASVLQAFSSGQSVRMHNAEAHRSSLHMPIKMGDTVIGVISTEQKAEGRPFDDRDVSLLAGLAEYAVVAIHNARAYQVMEEQARRQVVSPPLPGPLPVSEITEADPEVLLQVVQVQGQEIREGLRGATHLAQELRQQVALVESLIARLDAQERTLEGLTNRLSLPKQGEAREEHPAPRPEQIESRPGIPFQGVLESLDDGVLVSDANDQVSMANSLAARILHQPVERLVGQPLSLVCTDPRWSKTYLILKAAARLGPDEPGYEIGAVETPLTIDEHMVKAVFVPLLRSPGEWQGAVAILRDVSEERDEHRSRDEFIAAISRDLQTPMTAIMGYTDLLLEQSVGSLNETQGHFLQRIKANVKRMVNMLRDLIGVTTIDSGSLAISPEPMNIHPFLDEALAEIQIQLADKDLAVERSIPDDLPAALADPGAIQHVLAHLLANAYKCSAVGGRIGVEVKVCTADELGNHAGGLKQVMVVAITDSGGGIAPEDQDSVFLCRYGEHLAVPGLGETGVGLSLAKQLIEAHGGQIWLESQMGHGTTFAFTLPLAETESSSMERA
ncbi:MAG: ATP-binding protein [Anaerolineae bacterium]|nr:ATP-binding protein [Anaerolineae bacterium]MDH7475291.1 ATP-binding protein [Anaerolineae bacterium]